MRNGVKKCMSAAAIISMIAAFTFTINLGFSNAMTARVVAQTSDDSAYSKTILSSRQDADPDYRQGLNEVEFSWCKPPSRWRRCHIAYKEDAIWAINNAAACQPLLCTNGDEQNALQHCLWSAIMNLDIGENNALGFLTRHEAFSNNNEDSQRDWQNNNLGFEVAQQVAADMQVDPQISKKQGVLNRCNDLARDERLVYIR